MGWFKKKAQPEVTKASRAFYIPAYSAVSGIPLDWKTKEYLQLFGEADYSSPWIYACARAVALAIASVNLKFYRDTKKGREELPGEHPLTKLFWNLNSRTTRFSFWELSIVNLELSGNCFWGMEDLDKNKQPDEMWVLRPDKMKIVPDEKGALKGYFYEISSTQKVSYTPDEMLHIKYPNPLNDFWGLSPLSAARQGVLADYYAAKFNQNFFKQGARPSGVLTTEDTLDDPSFQRLRAEFDQAYTGADRAHRPILLEKGLKWESANIPQRDMEFIEQRKLSREEILAVYKVPPIEVGILEHANFANAEVQDRIFWTKNIIPKLLMLEETLNTFLVPRFEKNVFGKFDLSRVPALQENEDLKSNIAMKLVQAGVWTQNEARHRLWNMEPVSWGNVWLVPFTMAPAGPSTAKEDKGDDKSGILAKQISQEDVLYAEYEASKNEIQIGEDLKLRPWYDFVLKSLPQEDRFAKAMRRFFREQKERVVERFERQKGHPPYITKDIFSDLFKGEDDELQGVTDKLFNNLFASAGKDTVERFSLSIDFDMERPGVVEFLKRKKLKVVRINDTTRDFIKDSLGEGIKEGEGIAQLAGRIRHVFDDAEQFRAVRIARTETIGVSNHASIEAYTQAGVEKKGWLTAGDEDVRDNHKIAGREYARGIPLGEFFIVGGYDLAEPGDQLHGADPSETVNCRCTTIPIIS